MISILALAAASINTPFTPAGKWEVGYNKYDCTLARRFSSNDRSIIVAFKPSVSLDAGSLVMILEKEVARGLRRGGGKLRLMPADKTFPMLWALAPIPERSSTGMSIFTVSTFWTALNQSQTLVVEPDFGPKTELQLGSLDNAWPALAACRNDLLHSWGIDAAAVTTPTSGLAAIFNSQGYPSAALKAREEGRVGAVTTINSSGRATHCRVVMSSESATLDRATCDVLMRKGQFAKSIDGPAERQVYTQVRWVLPGR